MVAGQTDLAHRAREGRAGVVMLLRPVLARRAAEAGGAGAAAGAIWSPLFGLPGDSVPQPTKGAAHVKQLQASETRNIFSITGTSEPYAR
jgi:hypothetical protein